MKECYKPSLLLSLLSLVVAFPAMSAIPPISPGPQTNPGAISSPSAIPNHLRFQIPIDLGTLGTTIPGGVPISAALALNNSAQVVGTTPPTPILIGTIWWNYAKGFVWKHGVMIAPFISAPDKGGTMNDINNSGMAVGTDDAVAYTYHNNTIKILKNISTANKSFAKGVSDTGKIVGISKTANGFFHAVAWDNNNNITDLGTLAGYSRTDAYGISNSGRFIVGQASGKVPLKAIIWDQNNVLSSLDNDPNSAGSMALAVNNSGVAVGHLTVVSAGTIVAVRWVNGNIEKLNGDTWGVASGINNSGQIVGSFNTLIPGVGDHAFLWDNGKFYDLNTLIPPNTGWLLTAAADINDKGEIAGTGIINGNERAFLMKLKP